MNGYRASFLTVTALFTLACGNSPQPELAIREDSVGTEIVTSPIDDRPLEWSLERAAALGGEDDGPQSFFRVAPGLVGSDGRGYVYVLDFEGTRVVVLETDGTFVRALGRQGEGPGEISDPASLAVNGDGTVSVFDFGKGALVRFGPDGGVLPETTFPFFPWPGPTRHIGAGPDGILVASRLPSPEEGRFRQGLRLLTDTDTILLAEQSYPSPGMQEYPSCGGGLNLPRIFEPELRWATNGESVVISASHSYELEVVQGAQPRRILRGSLPDRNATESMARAELGDGFTIDFGAGPCTISPSEMVAKRGFAEQVPWIDQVAISPTGEIWVLRKGLRDEAGAIDLFDDTGAYLGTLPPGSPFPIVFTDPDHFGAVETDEWDVSRLVIYAIRRYE